MTVIWCRRVAAVLMLSVVVVNVVTIAADVQAGAAGIGLLAGIDTERDAVLAVALSSPHHGDTVVLA